MKKILLIMFCMVLLLGSLSAMTSSFKGNVNVEGNIYALWNLSVWDLTVRSGNSIHLAGADFSNEGMFTSVNTDWGVHVDNEPTAFIGIYAHNASVLTHANLILEAGEENNHSMFEIIKTNNQFESGEVSFVNEDGRIASFIYHDSDFKWSHFDNVTKDEHGNIEGIFGVQDLMMLNDTSLNLLDMDLIVNGNATANYFIGDGSSLTDITLDRIISSDGGNYVLASNSFTRMVVNDYIRLNINSATAYMRSNDGTNRIEVKVGSIAIEENSKKRLWIDNVFTELYSPSQLNYLRVYNSGLLFEYNTTDRLKINENYTLMLSPDGTQFLHTNNTGAYYNDVLIGTGNGGSVAITSPDGLKNLTITNTDLIYNDGTRERLDISAVHTKFFSPDGDYTLLDNNQYVYNDGTRNRLEINGAGSMLVSPNGAETLIVSNDGLLYNMVEIATVNDISPNWDTAYGWGDHSGLYSLLNHKEDSLYSPDNLKNLTLTNTNLIYQFGNSQRFIIDSVGSGLFSPDGFQTLLVTDAGATYNGAEIATINDLHDSDKIVSLDGLSNVSVNNSGTYVNGYFTFGDDLIYNRDNLYLILQSPGKNHNLVVGNDAVTVDGGQVFTASNTLSQISDVTPYSSDGNILVWNATSSMWENRTSAGHDSDKIISPDTNKNLTITNTDLKYNDGIKNRIDITTTNTALRASDGGYLYLLNGAFSYYDGTRNRIVAAPTESKFDSPDGTKSIKITNTEITNTGFTKLGSSAPEIKMKKLTGTTPAVEGNSVTITHGLTGSKILAVDVLVGYSSNANNGMPPGYLRIAGYEYYAYQTSSGIVVYLSATNSERVLSDNIRILITYEA